MNGRIIAITVVAGVSLVGGAAVYALVSAIRMIDDCLVELGVCDD